MASDIEIAQKAKMQRVSTLAKEKLGIADEHLEPYGHYKAKVSLGFVDSLKGKPDGKLILVTAISPTPARPIACPRMVASRMPVSLTLSVPYFSCSPRKPWFTSPN